MCVRRVYYVVALRCSIGESAGDFAGARFYGIYVVENCRKGDICVVIIFCMLVDNSLFHPPDRFLPTNFVKQVC